MPQDSILSLNQLSLKRGGRILVQNLELSLSHGETGLVLGSNGSGKTTLSETICGFIKPYAGTITKPTRLGWASQDPRFPLTSRCHDYLFQLAVLGGSPSKVATLEADAALARFGLDDYGKRKIGSLSRGWQQRLNLARAWLGSPQLLVLDEPRTALDPLGMELLAHAITGASCVLILSPPGTGEEELTPCCLNLDEASTP
ncbi:MAG: ATP-binding cassette domain-containing protein [Planctomycetota bacterium]|jgi:ABC-type multidrug transport system ATPase subunit|nr:ATP-binding cassette domain-containing protein [Planctomycetota bacterium]MDP6941988.1 ATP-binding cassette domain-containing protein [Planctomycetota bacterium]